MEGNRGPRITDVLTPATFLNAVCLVVATVCLAACGPLLPPEAVEVVVTVPPEPVELTEAPETPLAATPTEAPTDTPLPAPTLTPTPLPKVMVEAEWPSRMEIDRSDYVRVSLVRTAEGGFTPTVEVAGHTAVVATPIPVGTPGAPLATAFGPACKASAVARLEGAAFEISLLEPEVQSLDQDRITWDWNILPVKPGSQTVNACVIVRWQPSEGEWDAIERMVWRAPLAIEVEEPWIKTGQLSVLSLASSLLGSVLTAPWLYQRISKIGERRRKRSDPVYLRRQLAEARENLRLIHERKSQFVLETDVPLRLIKEERRLLARIAELQQRIEELEQSRSDGPEGGALAISSTGREG